MSTHASLNTSVMNLSGHVNERIRREQEYIDAIKDEIFTIVQALTVCNEHASTAIASGNITDSDRDDINNKIRALTARLDELDPLNSRELIDPLSEYARTNLSTDDPDSRTRNLYSPQPYSSIPLLSAHAPTAPRAQSASTAPVISHAPTAPVISSAPKASTDAPGFFSKFFKGTSTPAPNSASSTHDPKYSEFAKEPLVPRHDAVIPDFGKYEKPEGMDRLYGDGDDDIKDIYRPKEVRPPINHTAVFNDYRTNHKSHGSPLIPHYESVLPSVHDDSKYFDESVPKRGTILGGWKQNRSKRIRSKRHSKRR